MSVTLAGEFPNHRSQLVYTNEAFGWKQMFRVDSFETICVLSPSACGAISGMAHLAQAVKSQSCDKEIKVDSCL